MITDNYITMVFEHEMQCLKEEQQAEVIQMIRESAIIMEALESGYITEFLPVEEAVPGTGLVKSAYEAFMAIVDKLATAFMKAANKKAYAAFGDEGVGQLKANMDTLIERANQLQPRKMTPCWKGKIINGLDDCTKGIEQGFNNVKNKKLDDHNWIPQFITNPEIVTDPKNKDLSPLLKSYLLTGSNKPVADMRQTIDGGTIAKHVKEMVDFMENYKKNSEYIANEFKAAAKRRPKDAEMDRDTVGAGNTPDQRANDVQNKTTESFTPDTYIMVENCTVRETTLPLAINYKEVIEADVPPTNNATTNNNPAPKPQVDPKDAVSPSKIEKVGDQRADNAEQEKKSEMKSESAKRKEYCKVVERFQRISQAALQYCFEVKFHIYYAILKEIGRDFIKPGDPKKEPKQTTPTNTENKNQ